MPRYYTIASSNKAWPDKIRIAISLTIDKVGDKEVLGFNSQFLQNAFDHIQAGKTGPTECNIFVKDSMFELPNAVNIPLIMVGPGTGIVPFIGFIEQRQELFNLQQDEDELEDLKSKLGETKLYFGCRRPNSDYIFKRFLENAVENGTISSLNVAFSRATEALQKNDSLFVD